VRIRTITIAVLLTAAVGLAGCGTTPAAGTGGKSEVHVSRATDYQTLDQLRLASTSVVKVVAGAATVETLHGIDFTVTTAEVVEVLSGEVLTDTIAIRQLGSDQIVSRETSERLAAGAEYVVFVKPFEMTRGVPTGQYVVIGGRGLYKLDGDTYTFRGGEGSLLPTTIPAAEQAQFTS
jgi:hypothetical protein